MMLQLFMFKKMIIEFIFRMSKGEAIDIMKNGHIKEKILTKYFFKYK